jgi:hypothetical protein
VKIPAMQSQSVGVNTFWYSTPSDLADSALREEREEMRRELKGERVKGAGGCNLTADLNVVHTYWMVTYNIEDPVLYLQNVLVEEGRDEKELIKHAVERAVVQAVAGVGVYDALYLKTRELATAVTRLAQEKLRSTGVAAGVQIQQVLNSPPPVPPPSVRAAFSEASAARQEMKQSVEKALGYRAEQLTQAAGLVGLEVDDPLDRRGLGDLFTELGEAQEGLRKLSRLRAEIQKANDALAKAPEKERAPWEATLAELRKEVAGLEAREKECEAKATELPAKIDKLYARAGAEVERIRNEAQEYKRRLVESAKGDADVISSLVAQFPGEPDKLRTWRDHYLLQQIEEVLAEAEQLYVVHEGTSGKDQVISIQLTPPIELIKKQRKLEETH